jgi:hypothetical protein
MFTSLLGNSDTKQFKYKLLFMLYALFLFLLSASKSAELFLPQILALQAWLGGDKLMHLKLAAVLSFIATTAFAPIESKRRGLALVVTMTLLAGALLLDELHQLLLGSRHFDWADTAYGLVGLVLGLTSRFLIDIPIYAIKYRNRVKNINK